MRRTRVLLLFLVAIFLLTGCGRIRAILNDRLQPRPTAVSETRTPLEDETREAKPMETPEPVVTPEPTETPEPTATPEPTPSPAPTCTKVSVVYDTGRVTVTGLDTPDGKLWSKDFKLGDETELTPYSEATIADGTVYLQVNYHMLALNGATGATLWTSQCEGGLSKPVVMDGKLYTCSYYGSPLVALSTADGSTLFEAEQVDDTYIWPYKVELQDNKLLVSFDQAGGEESKGTALFDMDGHLIRKGIVPASN